MFVIKRVPICKENEGMTTSLPISVIVYSMFIMVRYTLRFMMNGESSHIWASMMVDDGLVPM